MLPRHSQVGLALLAAAAWAAYILLNRSLGRQLPGLQGTAAASVLTAAAWTPIAAVWFVFHLPTAESILLAVACGVLSSVIPYAADLLSLRRVPASVFSTLTSVNPVWAALAGWILLQQALQLYEWVGIGLIVLSDALVSASGLRPTTMKPQWRPRQDSNL
ncbi:EamA family transporter [Gulosibacter chungangensis]|uniref:EamA family transporter n=1 Tax=Gulosibacter chungangensis TaxID=979746 RepID=UPI001CE3F79C|nr:EamA family transporter [Gulosibacter chungangensis]